MTDYALHQAIAIDQRIPSGTYVKIGAESSKHKGLYGWVGETWWHDGRWFVTVHDRCDLGGYYQWFLLDEVYPAKDEVEFTEEEKAERRRRMDRARKAQARKRAQS